MTALNIFLMEWKRVSQSGRQHSTYIDVITVCTSKFCSHKNLIRNWSETRTTTNDRLWSISVCWTCTDILHFETLSNIVAVQFFFNIPYVRFHGYFQSLLIPESGLASPDLGSLLSWFWLSQVEQGPQQGCGCNGGTAEERNCTEEKELNGGTAEDSPEHDPNTDI